MQLYFIRLLLVIVRFDYFRLLSRIITLDLVCKLNYKWSKVLLADANAD